MRKSTSRPDDAAGQKGEGRDLVQIREEALARTARAYESISRYCDRSAEYGDGRMANVRDARYYAGAAMVNLASAGSDDDAAVRETLARYGLDDLLLP